MKKILIIMGLISFFGCGSKNKLPQNESDLLAKLNFNVGLLTELRNSTNSELKQLPAIDQETGDILNEKYEGVYSLITEERSIELVKSLKEKFRTKGYLIFVLEGEDNTKSVAVIKGTDELDILRYRRTDGINHDLENDDIVSKISDWKNKYGLIILGCSRDWLQIEFDRLPENLDEFADEVYAFCPDSVDQGVGDIESLKMAIELMKGLWLWWD